MRNRLPRLEGAEELSQSICQCDPESSTGAITSRTTTFNKPEFSLRYGHRPRWITPRLRIATHIGIGILTRAIALHHIRRQEHPRHRVIVTRPIVVQSGQAVVVLPGKAFGGVDRPFGVTALAIRPEDLVAFDGSSPGHVIEAGQHATQAVREVEDRAIAVQCADQPTCQRVVIRIPLVGAGAAVLVFLQPKGRDGHAGTAAVRRTAQHALAGGIVDILFLVGAAHVPLREVVEQIVGEGGSGAAVAAAGDVTPGIVLEA